jgi:hypothetical protein
MIPAGSVFAFLAEHRRVLFPSQAFVDMYAPANGRPSAPVDAGNSAVGTDLGGLAFQRWQA